MKKAISCRSAWIGAIGAFAVDPQTEIQIVDQICKAVRYWLPRNWHDGVPSLVYEAVWTLNEMTERSQTGTHMRMGQACQMLAGSIL